MQAAANIDLSAFFDNETLEKARLDHKRKKVLTAVWEDEDDLVGRVTGSNNQLHTCTVCFDEDHAKILFSECTCAEVFNCRHAASLVLVYLENPSSIKPSEDLVSSKDKVPGSVKPASRIPATAFDRGFAASMLESPLRVIPGTQKIPDKWIEAKPDIKRSISAILETVSIHRVLTEDEEDDDVSSTRILYILDDPTMENRPDLDIVSVNIKKDGSFGASRSVNLHGDDDIDGEGLAEDIAIRQIWSILRFSDFSVPINKRFVCDDITHLFNALMVRILATGRCHLKSKSSTALKVGPELPGELVWEETENNVKGAPGLRLAIRAIDGEHKHPCLRWYYPWYINRETNECGPVNLNLSPAVLSSALDLRPISKEESVSTSLLVADKGLIGVLPLPPTESQKVEIRLVKRRPKLVLSDLTLQKACNCDTADSANHSPSHNGEKKPWRVLLLSFPPASITDKTYKNSLGWTIIEKQDRSSYVDSIMKIEDLGFSEITDQVAMSAPNEHFFAPDDPLVWADLDAQKISELRSSGFDISAETEQLLKPKCIVDSCVEFRLKEQKDWWYTMEISINLYGKKVPLLPILTSALKRLPCLSSAAIESLSHKGKFMFPLEDGTLAWMPFERIRTMLLALQDLLGDATDKELKLSALHAAQLLDDQGLKKSRWVGAESLHKFVENLSTLRAVPPIKAPPGFQAKLRPYQEQGLGWLKLIARSGLGGILADDMGLGKTVQMLAHIAIEKQEGRLKAPVMVVCPTSLLHNWVQEIEKLVPQLKYVVYAGPDRSSMLKQISTADIVVTSYGLIPRDIAKLKELKWSGIVLDEAQAIKNPAARITSAVKELKADYRFCLTGTPVENHLGELWSEFDFLVSGLLGDKAGFTRHLRNPIEVQGNVHRQVALANRIRPFVLRRTKAEVLPDLPEKVTIVKQIELSERQRDLYETVRVACAEQIQSEIALKGFNKSQLIILDALLKLRQVCCDPRILKLPAARSVEESAKLDELIDMIEQLASEGRKILVFSQFTSMLDLIGEDLNKKEIRFVELRGDTKDRVTPVKTFQETDVPVFLLSLKAGGVGLNLTAADVVVHFDPWWNPAAEDQATDRAYRIGQSKNVFVYKLIAYGTIEQRLLDLQERKRALASSIYSDNQNAVSAFTEDDLANLLKPISAL